MNTLSVTSSESRINSATSLEYLATLISQKMTPPRGYRALPNEQLDPPLPQSKVDEDNQGQNTDALSSSPPDSAIILSPTSTHSSIPEDLSPSQVDSCPFDDYVLWGALVTSTPHVVPKLNPVPKDCPKSPSFSDSDISEIQIIPRCLDPRSISSSPTTTSQHSDTFSSYSSASPSSPITKDMAIAQEYDFLADWLTELSITSPVANDQEGLALSTEDSVLAGLDLGASPMNGEDHPSHIFDDVNDTHEEPIQQSLAPKVSYSLLRHFEQLNSSFNMTPPKISTPSPCSSCPSLKNILSNTSTRSSEKQTTTPKMLKFKRDLGRKTRKAKKGLLDFSCKMKNRFQEQYNANFKVASAAKAVHGMRLAGCRADLGCIPNHGSSLGFNPPVSVDWSFEVPGGYALRAGLAMNAGIIPPLKTSRSSAFPSLNSVPGISDLDEKLKAVQPVPDSTAKHSATVPTSPSMHTLSSWSFSTDHDEEEGCPSPTCAGSEPTHNHPIGHVHPNPLVGHFIPIDSSDLAPVAPGIENADQPNIVGLATRTNLTDIHLPTATSSCSRCLSIRPHMSDHASMSACCNYPAFAMMLPRLKSTTRIDTALHGFDLKLDLDLDLDLELEHDTTSTLNGGAGDSVHTEILNKGIRTGKDKEREPVLEPNASDVTDYLGLRALTSALGSGLGYTWSSPNPMLSESNVALPGAYIFDDGELDASRSFSAALGRAYKLLFDQASVDV